MRRSRTPAARWAVALLTLGAASPAYAHDGRPLEPHDLWGAWELDLAVVLPLLASGLLYWIGVRRLWRAAARGRGLRRGHVATFTAGWVTLAVALVSPLHALGGVLFSAHMTQHQLLIGLAAPLLVLGRPLVAFLWAFPAPARRRLGLWTRRPEVQSTWRLVSRPGFAWWIHAGALGVWHVPVLYDATVTSRAAHAAQHASFIGTALLFWWAAFNPGRQRYGFAVVYLFAATILTGALGALLAFAPMPWYEAYTATTGAWGLTPLDDQQLGGVIMWVPGGLTYLVAGVALFGLWLRESERRTSDRDRRVLTAAALAMLGTATGCERAPHDLADLAGGDPRRGQAAIRQYGCGSCHTIPGIRGADGLVGPPLAGVGSRSYVAGVLTNTPENMVRWIQDPPSVDPKTAMPNLGVTHREAVDIAGYLYTLK